MPSIRQSIRSSTASKRPTSAIADGQIALNTASGTPGMFFKDSAGNIVKTGPAHYGATAPNSSPAVGGSTGNSFGEAWLDVSLTPAGWKIWNGSAWVNATPLSSDTVQGLVELATNAETQAGVDAARAVTAASLQSKVSDSISTTSASGIASSTAVKTAYDLANAALPKTGGIITGNLEIGSTGSFTFEGSTADGFETTLAVVDPTADRTITFPNITGTVVTTGDTGTVTSTMILDGTILNADINASAAIAFSKLATLSSANILVGSASGVPTSVAMSGDITIGNTGVAAITSNVIVNADINASAAIVDTKLDTIATALKVSNSATTAASANTASAIVARDASGNFTAGTITAALTGAASSNVLKAGDTMTGVLAVTAGTAALPGIAVSGDLNTGIYSPGADQLAISTNGTGRLFVDASGNVGVSDSSPSTNTVGAGAPTVVLRGSSGAQPTRSAGLCFISQDGTSKTLQYHDSGIFYTQSTTATAQVWFTNNLERLRLTSAGLLGLGTTDMYGTLNVQRNTSAQYSTISLGDFATAANSVGIYGRVTSSGVFGISSAGAPIVFYNTGSGTGEVTRIDGSGRLLVGTPSAGSSLTKTIELANAGTGTSQPSYQVYSFPGTSDINCGYFQFYKSRGATVGTNTIIASGDTLGQIYWNGANGTGYDTAASIKAEVDGVPGASADMPGRLIFSTTSDGSATPTPRLTIDSNGFAKYAGSIGRGAPVTKTGAFTVGIAENWLICNGTASITVTLPTASAWTGREIMLKTIAAFTVVSASSNVVPLAGGAAATAILAATAGKFATLVSDGTNWIIMQAN